MSGISPVTSVSSMLTMVGNSFTSLDDQSAWAATAAFVRTRPWKTRSGKASTRMVARLPLLGDLVLLVATTRRGPWSSDHSRLADQPAEPVRESEQAGRGWTRTRRSADGSSPRIRDTSASWILAVTCIRVRSGMRSIFCPSFTCSPTAIIASCSPRTGMFGSL